MTAVLVFLLVIGAVSGWWLSHQRLMSKPWLESGLDSVVEGTDGMGLPRAKIGLIVFLGVVGILFAMFTSGYFMRQDQADWRNVPMPNIIWFNTVLLVVGSVAMQLALKAARDYNHTATKNRLGLASLATLGFLGGQLLAWQQLIDSGFVFSGNPANSFFYLLTGLHGMHIIGGLVALGRTTLSAFENAPMNDLRLRIDLCALYWHFLLFIWFVLLAVMLGWAHDPFLNSHI